MAEPKVTELLEASLARVWNDCDGQRRLAALAELYHADARVHEPERSVTGHAAISEVVAGVFAAMPPGFRFEVVGPTLGHNGVAITRWHGGPPGQVIVSGADTIRAVDGQIQEHWIFFDPAP